METVEQLVSFHHIQVQLNGGAPWGFTLKGGLEHGEPLIITKIEDGGKAAHCKRLKVGDELININGSTLYGSRQEALILIKGSYRILKLTVRRRSVPLIRPHSWHLAKLSEPLLPPPPPSPPLLTPRLPLADSPPLPPPPPPSAMQLHSGSYTLPWHTTDNSDVSMQWSQLPRPYSSTDRSSSLGSMESLDTPTPTTQPYSDSHNSPVDPTLFNNKRDSAYSSFSASSNTSDYAAVPLRPGEASSMDNLLQSLGPACQGYSGEASTLGRSPGEAPDEAHLIVHKSRSLTRPKTRPAEIKGRPSSCCYEHDQREGGLDIVRNGESQVGRKNNPPQPPTRKDSFRATRSRTNDGNKHCISSAVENTSCCKENLPCLNVDSGIQNGFSAPGEGDQTENLKTDSTHSHFSQRQIDEFRHIKCDGSTENDSKSEAPSEHLSDSVPTSKVPITPSASASLPSESSTEIQGQSHVDHCQTNHSSAGLHRHSAPEKLLATQLQLLQFNSNDSSLEPFNPLNPSDHSVLACSSQWSHASSLQHTTEDSTLPTSHKLEGSRCSTPGSVFLEAEGEDGASVERLEAVGVNGRSLSPVHHHTPWGRSASVPGEPTGLSTRERLNSDHMAESDFQPLSAAASVDTLLDEQMLVEKRRTGDKNGEVAEREENTKKSNSSKNFRRNRRRSERFATNLRNEIQRKKAQLQRGHGPGGLLCSRETVQEEECSDLCEDGADPNRPIRKKSAKVAFATPGVPQDSQNSSQVKTSKTSREPDCGISQTQTTSFPQGNNRSRSVQILDPGVPSFGVGIRVVEEPAPAGKARRWRWTPEHKLQPELDGDRRCGVSGERVLGVTGSRHGVCAFTSSSGSSYSRSSSSSRIEESDILPFADRMKFFEETSKGIPVSNTSKRSNHRQNQPDRHREQQTGDLGQNSTQRRYSYQGVQEESVHPPNNVEPRRQAVSAIRERQIEMEREREERLREMERQQQLERQERELEMERARLREIQREERMRQREREQERELQRKKEAEMERVEHFQHAPPQDCYSHSGIREQEREIQLKDQFHNWQPKPQTFSHCQNQVQGSAFYPISHHLQPEKQESLHQGYKARSYTPTETFHALQQEMVKLNRKYSLTERDYSSWRRESRPPPAVHQQQHHLHQVHWDSRRPASRGDERDVYNAAPPPAPLYLRGRAMSENDLRFETSHRWSPSIYAASSQTLSEMEEGGDSSSAARQRKKKTPPPPRPPPPKWEQFHRRRASHHALLASSTFAAPQPIPSSFDSTEGRYSVHSSSYVPPPDESRQRSYSLPPERQEASETCSRCSCSQTQTQEHAFSRLSSQSPAPFQEHASAVAPPSPMFSRKAFRPVAPRHVEREDDFVVEPVASLPPPLPAKTRMRSPSGLNVGLSLDLKPLPSIRPGAERERPPSPGVHSPSLGLEVGRPREDYPTEAYFSQVELEHQQAFTNRDFQVEGQQKHAESEKPLSLSPVHSLEAELEVPLETDIDDFQELPVEDMPITSELPCFAQPVTVLETDIDTLPDPEASPSAETLDGSGSLDEEELELFPPSGEGESGTESWREASQSVEHNTNSLDRQSRASSSCSSYYHTSAAKAQLLSQMKDFTDSREKHEDDELAYKKQLMESLRKKLGVLREAQRGLQEDIRANAQLGDEVENMVVSVCKPNEVDKYRMFIGDLDKVVSLMLSLSGRLLRVETTLDTLDPETEHQDRLPLLEKKRQLMRQLSEAQDLKDHVDRREQAVSRVLARCLTPEQHRDYSHFVKMKAALLVEQRQLEDKIRLGEEQLRGLRESLGLGLGLGMGMGISMGYGHY
ncbi:protein Shroom4 isoform X1 [Xiphophorus hellerii]|uniref:protein Shroom4 isoform X1 n=2 Tax=Xiphophorus hellerii TaxID=8084 RepID=UPI0013B4308E|nr:protein Shroom4 isoform X1 [Xiphophorus hellerii]